MWSFNFTAQSGRPYSQPSGVIAVSDIQAPFFLERNNARLRPYHRLDFSWKIKGTKREDLRWKSDWTFTVYNLYGRRNPFNVYYTQNGNSGDASVFSNNPLNAFELAVLNSPLLSLTYNFVFQ